VGDEPVDYVENAGTERSSGARAGIGQRGSCQPDPNPAADAHLG